MIKMMSPRAMYHTMGKKNFLEYILFGVFVLFFYLPPSEPLYAGLCEQI